MWGLNRVYMVELDSLKDLCNVNHYLRSEKSSVWEEYIQEDYTNGVYTICEYNTVSGLTLTSDKYILTATDNTCILTVHVLNEMGGDLRDKTVKLYTGDVLVGDMVFNMNGTYTYEYTHNTTSNISFKAKCGNITSNTILVQYDSGGQVIVDSVTLSVDKNILSAYDSDEVVLSALVEDNNDDPCSNVSVEFFNGDVSMGSEETDTNGVATVTYSALGTGDVVFSAICSEVTSDEITVEDCIYYHEDEITGSSNYLTLCDLSDMTIPSPVMLTFDYKTNYEGRIGFFSKEYFVSPNNPNYSVFVGTPNGSKWYYGYRGTSTSTTDVNESPTDYHSYGIRRDRNIFRYRRDTGTVNTKTISWEFDNYSYVIGMMQWGSGQSCSAKNIKLKVI